MATFLSLNFTSNNMTNFCACQWIYYILLLLSKIVSLCGPPLNSSTTESSSHLPHWNVALDLKYPAALEPDTGIKTCTIMLTIRNNIITIQNLDLSIWH